MPAFLWEFCKAKKMTKCVLQIFAIIRPKNKAEINKSWSQELLVFVSRYDIFSSIATTFGFVMSKYVRGSMLIN